MTDSRRHPMTPLVPPAYITDIYTPEEQEVLFGVVRDKGPWPLTVAHHFKTAEEYLAVSGPKDLDPSVKLELSDLLTPTFRGYLANHGVAYEREIHDIYFNRRLLDMIRGMHNAEFAIPHQYVFNIRPPAHSFDAGHFDGASWRGVNMNNAPLWLVSVMAKSGLFDRWSVKAGQVIAYYYDSEIDGGFTYWPEGPDSPPKRFAPPFWNSGLLTDNEKMFHRGEANGPRDRRKVQGLQLNSLISAENDADWVIRNDGTEIARYHKDEMRFLVHYSAHVFDDRADLMRYLNHTDDLTVDMALNMLIDDMCSRGVSFETPSDPLHDSSFTDLANRIYAMAPSSYPSVAPLDRVGAV
ncbi:hypothetical protein [Rhodococcus sp. (in: high G+C Gram-positive bacteria)]|uniref:hypothetical protein n=1 Tax=Rhodococcus sp. TaxID=1831 RepID=UPI00257D655F|nr:hypothetical protein [Rhodococcus sp. (in: high G+C Gram-positive bacteria)]MBQ7803107.1 hypothetical protein [Rhodococcus sp. (in: high G+C Gram-positive bacteria)]